MNLFKIFYGIIVLSMLSGIGVSLKHIDCKLNGHPACESRD